MGRTPDTASRADAAPAITGTTGASRRRWTELLDNLAGLLPAGKAFVLIDGDGAEPGMVADRLAPVLHAGGRRCLRLPGNGRAAARQAADPCIPAATVMLADGARWRQVRPWDVVIWLRTQRATDRNHDGDRNHDSRRDGEAGADIVVDLHDPAWPVIRRVAAPLAGRGLWYVTETRAFFSPRAATWDAKFGDDLPARPARAPCTAGVFMSAKREVASPAPPCETRPRGGAPQVVTLRAREAGAVRRRGTPRPSPAGRRRRGGSRC